NLIFVNFILNLDRNSVFPCLELVVVDTKTIFERRILESCNKALAITNITSESILISILYLIALIPWTESDRKRGRGRPPYVYLPTSCNTEMFFVVRIWLRLDSNRALHGFLAMDYYPYNRKVAG
ncbi:MAG: hypothetical protein WBZ20_02140, partial [Nitrososphaeraceae archaeon]